MLRNIKSLVGREIHATDGELGKVDEFLFDDTTCNIRYMVAETGSWLSGRKVLIAPAALKKAPDPRLRVFPVNLTREQVRTSPDIDTDKTVTRLHELELYKHYAWPVYWGEGFNTGRMLFQPAQQEEESEEDRKALEEAHLQSTRAVTGYRIHAADGLIGHIEDYIVDDEKWAIRYLVADLGTWLPGRKVLISPHWIERVDWETSEVFVDLTRAAIQASPGFDPSVPVSEDYESDLYDHYGRPKFEDAIKADPVLPHGRKR
ncbi:MAG: PRC-barrel domain-containing protein [Elusimicrobiales bacterium]|nr:PRC-barrel domain-containing protein [Elusimicrobiales bacterium]